MGKTMHYIFNVVLGMREPSRNCERKLVARKDTRCYGRRVMTNYSFWHRKSYQRFIQRTNVCSNGEGWSRKQVIKKRVEKTRFPGKEFCQKDFRENNLRDAPTNRMQG